MQGRPHAAPASDPTGPLDCAYMRRTIEDRIVHPQPPARRAGLICGERRMRRPTACTLPPRIKRAAKIAAGALIVAVFGWIPLQALLQTSSVEAVINSRVVTLRAPIDGQISAPHPILLRTRRRRSRHDGPADRQCARRSRAPRRSAAPARAPRKRTAALLAKLVSAEAAQQDLARQAARFRHGRIRQLEARLAELRSRDRGRDCAPRRSHGCGRARILADALRQRIDGRDWRA